MTEAWRDIAARKQAERQTRIPAAWLLPASTDKDKANVLDIPRRSGILTSTELDITENFDATALLKSIESRQYTSEAITTAFCKRAAIAQQLTNCLTEIFFEDAIARAKELDAQLKQTGKPVGPLHGLPISLKDTFKIKGYDASVGVAALCFKPSTTNSALVDYLLSLGAVLYCKTNIPQTMSALDSHNNVFGRVRNPSNAALTAGGSSGGEGALISIRGSILGVGTDVGGSIRVPAICNGLYGVKPSHGRTPYLGQEGGKPEGSSKVAMEATAGPIAHSIRDCELFLRVIGDHQPWMLDPEVLPQSWEQQSSIHNYLVAPGNRRKPPLRIGIVRTDGITPPLPAVQRLIDEVATTLRSHPVFNLTQIQVVEIDISDLLSQCLKVANGIFSVDGGHGWFDLLEKTSEPLSPWLQNRLRRRPAKSVDEICKLQGQRINLQMKALGIWKQSGGFWKSSESSASTTGEENELDILICPAAPHPVPPIDRWNSVNYTASFNLLDLPAGVMPVRVVTPQDLADELAPGKPLNGWDKVNRELWGAEEKKAYEGSVLSIQVVAPRLQERKLVEAMAVVDDVLRRGRSAGKSSKL